MDDTTTSSTKRPRPSSQEEESQNLSGESSSPELKRLRRVSAEDYLLNILDEDDSTEAQEMDDGLASVMHSLEQEIRSGNGSLSQEMEGDKAASAQELGYLLEASDDELGIPPAAEDSSPAALAGDVVDLTGADVAEPPPAMYGQMWGFDDDVGFGSDFGFRPETVDDGYGYGFGSVGYDDVGVGLFDHSEPSDLTWRTMPAA
ncbi:hypothetical protein LUZ62_030711 [Rhynchospora pubera]|uniref:Uncharacterized protein n=1 Tax=Rhynchospora pubera TaxID=906938 RepID=A0AAV8HQQ2_9POAL|nr:hypothetical protein LUZ62_087120 [Rhynchospora pubera]KAJ4818145.1 hypothetical protein LUZ62_030711 [Rhynchospora pubera]